MLQDNSKRGLNRVYDLIFTLHHDLATDYYTYVPQTEISKRIKRGDDESFGLGLVGKEEMMRAFVWAWLERG